MTTKSANLTLAEALKDVIKQFIEKDQVQSGNHCLRCTLERAHAHMEASTETLAGLMSFAGHSHRTGKASQPESSQERNDAP